jgi:hypothetical protein
MSFTHCLIHDVILNEMAISSLCCPLILPHHVPNRFLFILHHVSFISAGFQLIFSRSNRRAWPCLSLPLPLPCFCLRTGSRKFWIQEITHISVGHSCSVPLSLKLLRSSMRHILSSFKRNLSLSS